MSFFAKPNFIIYDEWFDDDLEKSKLNFKNKKIKTIGKIHKFFYEQSNYKVGASENKMQIEIKQNEKEIITDNYFEKTSEKYSSLYNKKFYLFKKLAKSKLKLNITKKLIYSLSIFGFVLIFGFLPLFISQSKKNDSRIKNKSITLEKIFSLSKRNL